MIVLSKREGLRWKRETKVSLGEIMKNLFRWLCLGFGDVYDRVE